MADAPHETSIARKRGRVSQAFFSLFMKEATVISVETLSHDFYFITLSSPAFVGIVWTLGQKIQISIGSSFSTRTYTPFGWDSVRGQTSIVAYAHGLGPGAAWTRGVQTGDTCEVFGPRASLDLTSVTGPAVVIGDETSFGLSISMAQRKTHGPTRHIFEVSSIERARTVLQRFNLQDATLYQRTLGDEHLTDIEGRLPTMASPDTTWILTGRAGSVQRLRRFLKNTSPSRVMTKAYWAPGKTGLD